MTTDATGGYQPPGNGSSGSTTGAAKDQAAQVGQSAKEKGTEVATTAAEQAKNVAGETSTQARNLLQEAQTQVRDQAGSQKEKATGGLRSISDELRSLTDGGSGTAQTGMVTDLARQASDKVDALAGWIDSREPGELLEEIRDLARRKPGTFLLAAAAAGVLAGRLTRGAVDAKRAESDTDATYTGVAPGIATGDAASGSAWSAPAATTETRAPAEDVVVVEEAVVVETDPLGARPQRTTVGGERR
jgi:hypothetical protein